MNAPDLREAPVYVDEILEFLGESDLLNQSLADKLHHSLETPFNIQETSAVTAAILYLLNAKDLDNGQVLDFEFSSLNPNVIIALIDMTYAEVDEFPV